MRALATLPLPLSRTPPLALRNVLHGGMRSLLAVAGVAFSITLVLLQLGFLEAVRITTTTVFDQLDFDVVLLSPQYEQFFGPGAFPLRRLRDAESVPGVIAARPLYALMGFWRCPPFPVESTPGDAAAIEKLGVLKRWWLGNQRPRPLQLRELLVLGIDLERNPFREPIRSQVEAVRPQLRTRDRVLLNEWSSPDFGWQSRDEFSGWELNGQGVTVVGGFTLQRSFGADASVLTSDENGARALHLPGVGQINFGLLTVAPEQVDDAVRRLNLRLPPDVRAWSRADLVALEEDYWVRQTATGKIFSFGVLVTMIVAAVVIYQVLSNDVREHLPEYATLKAMGHTNACLSGVVVTQAMIYALAAYLPAVLVGAGLNNLAALLQATNRMAEAEPLLARAVRVFSRFRRSTGHEHQHLLITMRNYRDLLTVRKLAEPEIAARIKAASEGTDKLSPNLPDVERLLGPPKPVADVLTSLDQRYKEQGKPAVYLLGPKEPIAPHLDELLRPNGDGLTARGVDAFRRGAHADAVVLYEAALELMADQPTHGLAKLRTRMNRAAALRELALVEQARDELSSLLPELEKIPAATPLMNGRARYHVALCQWRLGEQEAAQKSAEESLASYDGAPKTEPVDPGMRRQSEELLAKRMTPTSGRGFSGSPVPAIPGRGFPPAGSSERGLLDTAPPSGKRLDGTCRLYPFYDANDD